MSKNRRERLVTLRSEVFLGSDIRTKEPCGGLPALWNRRKKGRLELECSVSFRSEAWEKEIPWEACSEKRKRDLLGKGFMGKGGWGGSFLEGETPPPWKKRRVKDHRRLSAYRRGKA